MDAAKEGDFNAGVSTMQVATRDMDDTLVLVCYSGKRYAQATTNVLSALGYDMSKVYTLEGGFTKWSGPIRTRSRNKQAETVLTNTRKYAIIRWYVSAGTQSLDDSSQDLVTGKNIIYILRRNFQ